MNLRLITKNQKNGILGGNGLLGSDLYKYFSQTGEVKSITKENYQEEKGNSYDVLINANGNSRRFWANENPVEDFEASTESVYRSLFDFKFKKYIYVSSPDVYIDHSNLTTTREDENNIGIRNPYGFNKSLSEQIVMNYASSYIIVRPGALLGRGLKKGPIFDVLHDQPSFVLKDSYFQFITTRAVAECLDTFLDKGIHNEIFNIAGKDQTTLSEVESISKKRIEISPKATLQQYKVNVEKAGLLYPLETSNNYLQEYIKSI